ncbi:hypothetical protein D9757_005022 [Collybiopsis confluens]|uniref:Uncharacterized protein n=1 Tax=Collybiopsis confluens TaxID=2823264 RepID=A0A8H5MCI5_9AGAR|nr:hypothetical protein D9757_005022 [Collybiopsis confluens]
MLACRADSRIGGSSPGEHELLINVTNYPTSTWYFDYITFESLADPVLDGEVLQAGNAELIDATNYSMLSFGPGWSINPDDSSVTSIPGSTASMKFNGTSISLYGDLLTNVSNTASYQVDDHDPVTVQMPGGIGSTTSSKYPLFTASDLSVGEHTLVLAFNGSKSGMPLDVNYFYVQSPTSAQQASPISPPPAPSKHSNRGVVLGAVLGSVIPVVLLFVLAAAWFWRRSRRKKAQRLITPFRQYEHDLVTTPLTNHDIINASSYQFGDTYSSSPSTKKEQNDVILAALRGGDSSQYPDSSGSGSGTGSGGRDEIPSSNLMTLKLGQRLAIMREQIDQRDRQLAEGSAQQQREFTVHTDSGLRLTGEGAVGLDEPPIEVPPGYTVN